MGKDTYSSRCQNRKWMKLIRLNTPKVERKREQEKREWDMDRKREKKQEWERKEKTELLSMKIRKELLMTTENKL